MVAILLLGAGEIPPSATTMLQCFGVRCLGNFSLRKVAVFNKHKYSERWWRERSHGFGVSPAGARCSHDFDTVQAMHLVEYNVYLGTLSNEREMLSEADRILRISVTAHSSQT